MIIFQPMPRLLSNLQSQSYGAKILGIGGSPADLSTGTAADITIVWDGTQSGGDESAAAALIAAFDWNPSADERVASTIFDSQIGGALAVVIDSLARGVSIPSWAASVVQTGSTDATGNYDAVAPSITVPGSQSALISVPYAITGTSITDAVLTGDIEVTLGASHGTFSLASTTGLTFSTGDGTADPLMVFTGSLSHCNTAIATITYTAGATGADSLTVRVSDQGNTVLGLPQYDSDAIAITVS